MSEPIETEVVPESMAVAVQAKQEPSALERSAIAPPAMTPAQAKVDAIASLTMKAYERAAELDLTPEESAALQADFPDDAFQPGAAGKENLIYIEHAHLRDRFNAVFGMGKWAIVPRNRWAEPFTIPANPKYNKLETEGSRVYVEAMLVVRGCFGGEAVGAMEYYPKNAAQNYGDAVEGAKTAAFRRCAKEFGVGLQAWKKEWCEGWWKRKRAGNAPHRPEAPAPRTAPQASSKVAPSPVSAPNPATVAKVATPATRDWMLKELADCADLAREYFDKIDQLLPNETLAEIPLRFVPVSKEQMAMLKTRIAAFGNGERAEPAFPADPIGDPAEEFKPVQKAAPPADDESWRDVVIPIPRKGMKRDEYLKNPDTIGSLFNLRHGESDECAAARQRLWGFVSHFEPKGWQKRDGTQMPASDADKEFREHLDAFQAWFERNHPDEKL